MGRHVSTIAVRFAELDPYSHVNHSVYTTYCEVARTEALASIGIPLEKLANEGFQFVVTDLAMRFRRPAVAGDVVTVETWLSEIGRASSRWSQRILRVDAASDTGSAVELVTAELKVGVCNSEGRPTRPAPWMLEALDGLLDDEGQADGPAEPDGP